MEQDMVSVIIPTFNRENTICRAIDSVINQTYKNIEIIVVDDCSTDNTEEFLIKYYKYPNFNYFKLTKNSGACYARNFGIKNSHGDFIAFQDSDDAWLPNKLCEQIKNIKKENSDGDFCSIEVIDEQKKMKYIRPTKNIRNKCTKNGVFNTLCYDSFISTQSFIGKKIIFDNIKFDNNLPRLQDYDIFLRISKKYKISYTQEPLAILYVQNDSISRSSQKLEQAINIIINKNYNMSEKELNVFLSKCYTDLGNNIRINNKHESICYYSRANKYKFRFKNLIKIILYQL